MGKSGIPKIGSKIVIEGEKEYKATIAEINKSMAVLASEAKKTAAAYAEDKDSIEALKAQTEDYNAQTEIQRKKVEELSKALEFATKQYGENDKKTKDWQIQLNKAEAELIKLESAIKKNNDKIEENSTLTARVKSVYGDWKDNINDLKEAHPHLVKNVENANKAAKALGSAGFNAIKTGAAAAIGGVTGFTAAGLAMAAKLNEISEETKELRENLGKLETGFTTNGHSAETAENTYKDLYTVLGDSDKATEAASHLALLCENQKQLDEWTTITTGVYAQFGDSLPIEALTEAANETAKTGSVTGALADALNWVGESEEGFQKKLEACNTEQERSELITKTLNGLYSEQAEKYREVNETLLAANEAQVEYDLKMAGLGDTVDGIKNKLKAEFLPGVSDVVDGLSAMLAGDEGAPELIKKGVTDCVNNFSEMVPVVLERLSSMGETLEDVAPEIVSVLANGITKSAPDMAESANKLISGLLTGLLTEENIKGFSEIATTLIKTLVDFIGNNSGKMSDSAVELIISLSESLIDSKTIQKILIAAFQIITELGGALIENTPELIGQAWKLGEAILLGIKEGIVAGWGNLKASVSGLFNDLFNSSEKELEINSPSKKSKRRIGKPFVDGIVSGIKENKKYAEVSAAELGTVIVKSATKELDAYKKYHEVTALEEAEFWNEIVNNCENGTAARIEAEEKYVEAVKKLKDESIETIQELTNAYNEAVEKRTNALLGEFSLFEKAKEKSDVNKRELQSNLNSQVKLLNDYADVMSSLSERVDNEDFIKELQLMGTGATGELEALNSMTDKQLEKYVATWEKRNQLAKDTAINELKSLEEETVESISSIATTVAKSCDEDYQKLGEELINSISEGIENEQGVLNDVVNAAILKAIENSSEPDGSHAGGIDYVPYDGYVAAMHRGEQLLTASEAVVYRNERAGSAEDYVELSRKIDALAARQEAPVVNWNLNANGSMSALVRALNITIERENRRKTAKR